MSILNSHLKSKLIVEYGGFSKEALLERLRVQGIMLNEFAQIIFLSELFQTSNQKKSILVVELSIKELGFAKGATMLEIKDSLKNFGLSECPLEIAVYLRLMLISQKEIKVSNQEKNKNPAGSLTVFSKPIIDDVDFPKGFYLRKIDGKLWIRGYKCSMDDYIWDPNDRFIFNVKDIN